MKVTLKISLLLNLVLLGALAWRLTQPDPMAAPAVAPGPVVAPSQPVAGRAAPAPRGEPEPFRWSRLESDDYRVYVKNLRSVGCPEAALRAIVTADVRAVYARRSQALEDKLAALAGAPWPAQLDGASQEQALRTEMLGLPGQEAAEIASLLGLNPPPDQTVAAAPPASAGADSPAPDEPPVSLPLVFQRVDSAALNLDGDQQAVIDQLRQNFMTQIGGTNQDPTDPAYLARWQKAQPAMDSMLRGMLGTEVFSKFQQAADNQQEAAAPAGQQ